MALAPSTCLEAGAGRFELEKEMVSSVGGTELSMEQGCGA